MTLRRWQRESPDDSPEASPRSPAADPLGYHQSVEEEAEGAGQGEQEEGALGSANQEEDVVENDTNKENTPVVRVAPATTLSAADEVSKVLAARRQRVEQAMQANEKHKEELASLSVSRKQRDLGETLDKLLRSFLRSHTSQRCASACSNLTCVS
jgi:hypothetical protein